MFPFKAFRVTIFILALAGALFANYTINCSNVDDGTPIVINGSNGFDIGGGKQIVWTNCQPSSPTGGVITTDGLYTVHTFTGNGTFYAPKGINAEVLVVAGGGGGGRDIYSGIRAAGGGGAGGLLYSPMQNITSGTYTVVVGAGGIGGINSNSNAVNGFQGENSTFLNYTAVGGGAGEGHAQSSPYTYNDRMDGGSGGGSAGNGILGAAGIDGQGYYGGNGSSFSPYTGGGGGGGANGTGGNTPDSDNAGIGGPGALYSISGASAYYSWGGNGTGGAGAVTGPAGAANTGAGGGGSRGADGGAGGSGVVIVRYLTADAQAQLELRYSTPSNYYVSNGIQQPMEVELGNGTSYLPKTVWTSANAVGVWHVKAGETTVTDSLDYNNQTASGAGASVIYDESIGRYIINQTDGSSIYATSDSPVNLPTGSNSATYLGWVRYDSGTTSYTQGACTLAGWRSLNIGGTYVLSGCGSDWDTGVSATAGAWAYTAMVWSGATDRAFYLNGTGVSTTSGAVSIDPSRGFRTGNGGGGDMVGGLYDLMIYNESKSAAFINQTFQNTLNTMGFGNLESNVSPATNGCVGATTTFICGDTVTESCTLNENLNATGATCLSIGAADVTIDCAGFSITGDDTSSTYGIYMPTLETNATIQNCNISGFDRGIDIENGNGGVISNDAVASSMEYSIYAYADNFMVFNSSFIGTGAAGSLFDGSSNVFTSNNISSDGIALYIGGSLGGVYLLNNFSGGSNVIWIGTSGSADNAFNDSTVGNYYYVNGVPAFEIYDITASSGTWADGGLDWPFNATTIPDHWVGTGTDWHPYTEVINTPPTISSISVIPAAPKDNESISCNVTVLDNEQALTNLSGSWFENGVLAPALNFVYNDLANDTPTDVNAISSVYLSPGANWSCEATAFDGHAYSAAAMSSNVTITDFTILDACTVLTSNVAYTLSTDVSGSGVCFSVEAPGASLNCNGFSITGTGIGLLSNQTGTIVRNCNFIGWDQDIVLNGANTSLVDNTSFASTIGLLVNATSFSNFTNLNMVDVSDKYILLANASTNNLFENISINGSTGAWAYYSEGASDSNVVNAFAINGTSNTGNYYCYQETANETSPCGGLATGGYSYSTTDAYFSYVYVNYSKIAGATADSLWQVKHGGANGGGHVAITYAAPISADCWSQDPLQFRMYSGTAPSPTDGSFGQCYNGTDWNTITLNITDFAGGGGGAGAPLGTFDGDWNTANDMGSTGWRGGDGYASDWFEEAMWWKMPVSNSTVNFTHTGDVAIRSYPNSSLAEQPAHYKNISRFFDIQNNSAAPSMPISFSYTATDVVSISPILETNLKVMHYNGTDWVELPSTVDTGNKLVSATITSFSPFGIMGYNEPPTEPTADTLTPISPLITDTLVAGCSGSTDAESESITYNYQFYDINASENRTPFGTTDTYALVPGIDSHHDFRVDCFAEDVDANSTTRTGTTIRTIGNTPPVTAEPTLSPIPAYKSTLTITCANETTSDADLDNVTFSYLWYLNGSSTGITTDTITNSSFNKGDSLICQITPNDGYENGAANNSSALVISNTGPAIAYPLSFTDFSAGHLFNVSAGVVDIDSAFDIASANISTDAGSCVYLFNSTSGDNFNATFECSSLAPATPTIVMGFTDLSGGYVETVPDSHAYPDHAPTINEPTVITAPFFATSTAACSPASNFSDIDGDTEDASSRTWQWFKNGTLQPGETASTLVFTAVDAIHFDNISCEETVNANIWTILTATNMSANVSLLNSAPVTGIPTLVPPYPASDDGVTCVNGTTSDADHDAVSFSYDWFLNSILVQSGANSSFGPAYVEGDNITCQITPYDGYVNGTSENVTTTVVNTLPVMQYVEILNDTNGYTFGVPATLHGWVRAEHLDGDNIGYNLTWTRVSDGFQISQAGGNYVPNMTVDAGNITRSNNREVWNLTAFAYELDEVGDSGNNTSYAVILSNTSIYGQAGTPVPADTSMQAILNLPGAGDVYLNKSVNYTFDSKYYQTYTVETYEDGVMIDQRDYILNPLNLTTDLLQATTYINTTTYGLHNYYVLAYDLFNTTTDTSATRNFEVSFAVEAQQPANLSSFNGSTITYSYNTTNLYPVTCAIIANAGVDDSRIVSSTSTQTVTVPKATGTYNWYVACYGTDQPDYWQNTSVRTYYFGSFGPTPTLPNYTNISLGPENVYGSPQAMFYDLSGNLNLLYYIDVNSSEYLKISTINGNSIQQQYYTSQSRGGDFVASFRLANNTTVLTFDNTTARFATFANGLITQSAISGLFFTGDNSYFDPYTYAYTKQFYNLTITPDSYYLFVLPSSSGADLIRMNATMNSSGVAPLTAIEMLGYPTAWGTVAKDSQLSEWFYAKPKIGGVSILNFSSIALEGSTPTYAPGVPIDTVSGGGSCYAPFHGTPTACAFAVNSNATLTLNGTGSIQMNLTAALNCNAETVPTGSGTFILTNGTDSITLSVIPGAPTASQPLTVTQAGSMVNVSNGSVTLQFANPDLLFNWTGSVTCPGTLCPGCGYIDTSASFVGQAVFPSTVGNTNSTITVYSYNDSDGSTEVATPDPSLYGASNISNATVAFEAYENKTYYVQFGSHVKPVIYQIGTGKNYSFSNPAVSPSNFYFVDDETFVFFSIEGGATWAYSCYFGNINASCNRISSTAYGVIVPYLRGKMTTSKRVPNILTGPQDVVTTGFIASGAGNMTTLFYNQYTYDLKMRCFDEDNETRKVMNVRIFSDTDSILMDPSTYLYGYVMQNSLMGTGLKKVYSYCVDPFNNSLNLGTNRMYVYDQPRALDTFSLQDVSPNQYYTFYVQDCFGQPSKNALVTAQRFMTDRNNWATVEQSYTSFGGDAVLFLEPFIQYKVNIITVDLVSQTLDFTPSTTASITVPMACSGLNINTTPTNYQVYENLNYDVKATAIPSGNDVTGMATNESVNLTYNYSGSLNRVYSANYQLWKTNGDGTMELLYNDTDYAFSGYRSFFVNSSTGPTTLTMILEMSVLRLDINNSGGTYDLANSTQRVEVVGRGYVTLKPYNAQVVTWSKSLQSFSANGGGWAWIFIVTILTMLLVGYVSRFTLDGAGIIGSIFFLTMAIINPVDLVIPGTSVGIAMWVLGAISLVVAIMLTVWRYI